MLNPVILTPVHGDVGRVQGAGVGRGGGSTLRQKGWPSPRSRAPAPLQPPPCRPPALGSGRCRGGSCDLSTGPSCCSGAPSRLFGATQAASPRSPRRNAPRASPTAAPAPTFPGHWLQRGKKKPVTFAMASILPLPPHPRLENAAHFLQFGMYYFFVAIVTMCKYLGLVGF